MASRSTCLASVSPATLLKVSVLFCIMVSRIAAWRLVRWEGRGGGGARETGRVKRGCDKDNVIDACGHVCACVGTCILLERGKCGGCYTDTFYCRMCSGPVYTS